MKGNKMTTKKESLENIQNDVMRSRKIGNNTFEIIYKDGNRAIRLHKTDIITFGATAFILNTGGWSTVTTKDRINKHIPCHYLFQKDFLLCSLPIQQMQCGLTDRTPEQSM